MMKAPTLIVMAAGMGSRYGGLKQVDGFGPGGETLLEYSVYDAIRAGFGRVVFVIKEEHRSLFEEQITSAFKDRIEVAFAYQEIPKHRKKPWGTGDAVWVSRDKVAGASATINADDFYGFGAFEKAAQFLKEEKKNYALVSYELSQTLSSHGTVSRGICTANEAGELLHIEETTGILATEHGIDSDAGPLPKDAATSMNFWVFQDDFWPHLEKALSAFIETHGKDPAAEFYLPSVLDELVRSCTVTVDVLKTGSPWFGVTYAADKDDVKRRLLEAIQRGEYPKALWS